MNQIKPNIYTPGAIVNYFLDKAQRTEKPLTPLKLQKLLYFANGWCSAFYEIPLINKPAHAWKLGPVYPDVYHEYKICGSNAIPYEMKMSELEITNKDNNTVKDGGFSFEIKIKNIDNNDATARDLLDNVWEAYSSYNGLTLSEMTHVNTPLNPWKKSIEKRESEINLSDTMEYFRFLRENGKLF